MDAATAQRGCRLDRYCYIDQPAVATSANKNRTFFTGHHPKAGKSCQAVARSEKELATCFGGSLISCAPFSATGLPDPLLIACELRDFVGCHRMHVCTELGELLLDVGVVHRLAEIL